MPMNSGVEGHLVVDDDFNIVIFVAKDRGSGELTIYFDHLSLLAIGRSRLPCNAPCSLKKRTRYAS